MEPTESRISFWRTLALSAILASALCSIQGCSSGSPGTPAPAQNPVPVLTNITPTSASTGSAAVTLTATGTSFIQSSQIAWNGTPVTTTFVSGTELQAQIPASSLTSAATVTVSVVTPSPGGGSSKSMSFMITLSISNVLILDVAGNDLAWDQSHQKIYVSVPNTASSNASTITIIDPISGTVGSSQSLTAEPSVLALSDDNQFLYAGVSGNFAVQRFVLPDLTPDINWTLGTDYLGNPNTATDIKVQPGSPHTVAIVRSGASPGDGGVAVYDDGAVRANVACGLGEFCALLQWKSDGTTLFAEDSESSARYFYILSVDSTGTKELQAFGGAFRAWGLHEHLDPATDYVYSDHGEVVNAANGLPVGNFPAGRCQVCYGDSPTLAAVDPAQQRVFFLTPVRDALGQRSFQIQVFDLSTFDLIGAFSIPNAVGTPTNFIRWGSAGLAFSTNNGPAPSVGKVYLIDGAFVNPSGTVEISVGTAMNPLPILTAVTPLSATVGGAGATISVIGRDFLGQATVLWNGTPLATTILSDTQLQAVVPASALTSSNLASVSVSNPTPGGGVSNSLAFAVNPAADAGNQISVLEAGGNDLVWNSQQQKIYVSQGSIQGDQGNSIAVVDPVAGTVTNSSFIGSDPSRLSISGDNQFLYVGMNGQNSVQRLSLPALTSDINWPLGADSFSGPFYAMDVLAAPGAPHTSAVSLANFDVSPSSTGIVIYDDSTARPVAAPGWNSSPFSYASIQWGSAASTLFAPAQSFPTDFYVLGVNASGVSISTTYPQALTFTSSDFGIHYDPGTGLIYTDGGQALDPTNGNVVGNFNASGIAVPDSSLARVFFLGQTTAQIGTSDFTIQAYDQQQLTLVDSIVISNVLGTPTGLIRWGTNGLAFTTRVGAPTDFTGIGPGQLYILTGNVVAAHAKSKAEPNLAGKPHVQRTWNLHHGSDRKALQDHTIR